MTLIDVIQEAVRDQNLNKRHQAIILKWLRELKRTDEKGLSGHKKRIKKKDDF